MGSIVYFLPVEQWTIVKESKDGKKILITIGELDDYYPDDPINVVMDKEIYEKIKKGEYILKRVKRNLQVLKQDKTTIICEF